MTLKIYPRAIYPSHVAILVPSVRRAADHLSQFGFEIGKEEEWDGEGTKEIYIERNKANSLLLMEPVKSGAYQRAMEKRGPGIHHLAIDVPDVEAYIQTLENSGWLLHPSSIRIMKKIRVAYLARPRFPALIEVQEMKEVNASPLFVEMIELQMEASLSRLLESIGLADIVRPSERGTQIQLAGKTIHLKDLF